MADYYPLIARAISGLDPSAPGDSRRALDGRARAARIAQRRSVQPPLSESEITRERLSLEEAVRKVESEAAQRAREVTRSIDPSRSGGDRARAGREAAQGAGEVPPPIAPSRSGGDRPGAGDASRAPTRPNARRAESMP